MLASRQRPRALALGIWLASRGALVVASLGLTAVGAIAAAGYAWVAPNRSASHVPTTATLAIAWSAGVMLAFGSALRAVTRDWEDGIIALARARGVRATAYVRGRVGGVVTVLAVAMGGAALVAGLAATSTASAPWEAAHDTVAALVYALAFAATIGPVAMATLSAQSRARGYFFLFAVLVAPELVAPWTSALLPRGWHELTSIPAALAAIMAGVESPAASGLRTLRAGVGLCAVVALSLVFVKLRLPRVAPAVPGDAT